MVKIKENANNKNPNTRRVVSFFIDAALNISEPEIRSDLSEGESFKKSETCFLSFFFLGALMRFTNVKRKMPLKIWFYTQI
jgi:hypothetical protein